MSALVLSENPTEPCPEEVGRPNALKEKAEDHDRANYGYGGPCVVSAKRCDRDSDGGNHQNKGPVEGHAQDQPSHICMVQRSLELSRVVL